MHHRAIALAIMALIGGASASGVAVAQSTAPVANHDAGTPAVANSAANNPGAPVAGANSFTETQARSRIGKAGYSNIGPLVKDRNGIWRGMATKDGTTFHVALDYQGNVVAK